MPSMQGVGRLVSHDVARQAEVDELAPGPEREELEAPRAPLVVGVRPPAGARDDEELRAAERPGDLAPQRVALLVHVHRPHDRGEHADRDEPRVVDVVLGDGVPAERAAAARWLVDRAALELFGVGVEVEHGDPRRDRTIEIVVLVDAQPILDRAVDLDAAEVGVLDHQRRADAHRPLPYPAAATIVSWTIATDR